MLLRIGSALSLGLLFLALPTFGQLTLSAERAVSAASLVPTDSAEPAAVLSDGDIYLVLWTEARTDRVRGVYAARVTMDGTLLDPAGVLLSAPNTDTNSVRAAWDGRDFVVLWRQSGDQPGTHLVRLDREGAVVRRNHIPEHIETMSANNGRVAAVKRLPRGSCEVGELDQELQFTPTLRLNDSACSGQLGPLGDGFLLMWLEWAPFPPFTSTVMVMNLGSRNATKERFALGGIDGDFERRLQAIESGSDTIILASSFDDARVIRLRADGSMKRIYTLPRGRTEPYPVDLLIAQPGGNYDVLLHDGYSLNLIRFTRDYPMRVDSHWLRDSRAHAAAAGPNGSTFLVTSNGAVEGRFLLGRPGVFPISRRAERQSDPALAPAKDGKILAVWNESHGPGDARIVGMSMHRDGSPAGAPFIVDESGYRSRPAIAFDGQGHVVVWSEWRGESAEIRARSLGGTGGQLLLTTRGNFEAAPVVASDGASTVVAYVAGWQPEVMVKTLTNSTTEMKVPGAKSHPAIASNGERYLVVANSASGGIRSAMVDRGGVVLGSDELVENAKNPAVAWNGKVFLLIYERDHAIYGTLVDRHGNRSGSDIRIATPSAGSLEELRVIWDGATFVTAFTLTMPFRTDVHARRVDATGNPQGPVMVVSKTPLDEVEPALVSLGGGASLVAYSRVVPEATGTMRVFTRGLGAPKRRASGR